MRRSSLLLLLAVAACSSGNQGPADAGHPDSGGNPVDAGYVDAGPLPYDPTCSKPGTPGNSLGIGRFCCDFQSHCTSTGTDCNSVPGGPALICSTVSAGVTQWFCTTPCTCDAECGEGAICACQGGCGCTPVVCAGDTEGTACYVDGGKVSVDAGPPDAGR